MRNWGGYKSWSKQGVLGSFKVDRMGSMFQLVGNWRNNKHWIRLDNSVSSKLQGGNFGKA